MHNTMRPLSGSDLLFSNQPLTDWQNFYVKVFNEHRGFHELESRARKEGFDWPIVVLRSMTISRVVAVSRQHFPVVIDGEDEHQTSLFITGHDRFPYRSYNVWVRPGMEADRIHDRKSADMLAIAGIPAITLLERLLLGLYVHWVTGEHLDREGITLCAGSRYVDEGVPAVSWTEDEELEIAWHAPDRRWPTVAVREVWDGE